MTRFSRIAILTGIFAATIGGFVGGGLALGGDKCTIATSGNSATAQACAKGGRPEAKKVMKKMVNDAKEKKQKYTCEGCHKDLDNYELTPNAKEDFKKLEALLAK